MKKWTVGMPDKKSISKIMLGCGVTPLTAAALVQKGYSSPESVAESLNISELSDPFLINDMQKAADVINEAIDSGERICVYGDYDCDGIFLDIVGVRTCWVDDRTILVPGNQHPKGRSVTVEGDYSNAAFLEVLNLFGGDVQVTGLSPDSLQGDRIYQEYFPRLKEDAPVLDIRDCPDLGPVLFAAAAVRGGGSFTGTERLRIKESDRLACMQKELAKFGIQTEIGDNTFTVLPGTLKAPAERLYGHNDHRIVMALSSLLTLTGGEIEGAEAVRKSWPDYFTVLQNLGIEVVLHAVDQ